jgi:hypothetical protein
MHCGSLYNEPCFLTTRAAGRSAGRSPATIS